jgi:hypothetical protein
MNMGSIAYGEGVETAAIKGGAPMAKTPDVRPASAAGVREAAMSPVTPLYAETQRPEEPITTGISMGPGAGPEALMMNQAAQRDKDIVAKYRPILETMAAMPDTPESFRIFVRYVQGDLG